MFTKLSQNFGPTVANPRKPVLYPIFRSTSSSPAFPDERPHQLLVVLEDQLAGVILSLCRSATWSSSFPRARSWQSPAPSWATCAGENVTGMRRRLNASRAKMDEPAGEVPAVREGDGDGRGSRSLLNPKPGQPSRSQKSSRLPPPRSMSGGTAAAARFSERVRAQTRLVLPVMPSTLMTMSP
jgi:hypothetical protein